VTFIRGGALHAFSFADCADRVVGKPRSRSPAAGLRSPDGKLVARIRSVHRRGADFGARTILVNGRPVYSVREDFRRVPAGTPGPLGLVRWSPDSRWLFFYVDPLGSASLAADGLVLRALRLSDGRRVQVATTLLYEDYLTWCGSKLVLVAGGNRLATTTKRLLVASAPDWKPRALWRAPGRAFGSAACAPDGKSVAVLSQPESDDYNFFHTRWQLWQVRLNGSRRLLDTPPAGWADESPRWLPDGRALLFVRERSGRGSLMLLREGRVSGPFATLGQSLGYYGHHDWWTS
jgi:WD40 repeat protein